MLVTMYIDILKVKKILHLLLAGTAVAYRDD